MPLSRAEKQRSSQLTVRLTRSQHHRLKQIAKRKKIPLRLIVGETVDRVIDEDRYPDHPDLGDKTMSSSSDQRPSDQSPPIPEVEKEMSVILESLGKLGSMRDRMRPWDTIRLCGMMGAALSEFSKGLISDLSDHRGQRTTGSYLLGTSETILNHGRSVMHSIESMERIFHLENDLHRLAGGVSVEEVMEDKTKEADPVH